MIKLKRVYDEFDITDGVRILVDRLWPRGIRRNSRNIDLWLKDVAPSDDLRKWFAHDTSKWGEFRKRYLKELHDNKAVQKLIDIINANNEVTLVYSTKDTKHNQAVVLLEFLKRKNYK
ncbi:MAG: DUF488 domain-containing protein [Candidatus Marsarchaeota archaeon]|jgi:uncharacterized protein YeaO (DUF488 family)|nr:DUF488 domain-containing protein [Candidatus Marsarchaeota archaeon]MCL5418334.1 DUF488 domain-containing protein [Candidatus Marsarchaeota archaeon]